MRKSVKLRIEQSELHQRIRELNALETLTDEQRSELDKATKRVQAIEIEVRAALTEESESERVETRDASNLTPEQRERLELRGRVSVGRYLAAALSGRQVTGAEAELQQAAGVDGIPIEAWETRGRLEARARAAAGTVEHRAITPAPGTVGINMDLLRPEVFAPSIADRLMIEMPMVESGTYATGTLTSGADSADAVAKSATVPQVAGAFTVGSTSPHRAGASLALTLEDIAAIGQANFESVLRDNISMVLADEIDDQMINGDNTNDDIYGMFERLTDASAPAAAVESWVRMLAIQASGIDGLWATELAHIAMVVNPETYRLAAATFQGTDSEDSAASYLKRAGADFWTNKRMPPKDSHIAKGILCRKGRPGMRTAVCPHWGTVAIDDIYSGALKGERYFTVSVLIGDVILVQPDAYAEVAFRVSV